MEGFTKLPKMQHFKEGGSVQKQIANYEKRERKTEEKADMAQDKAVVKKAIGLHDKQEHPGEKTDLSKLRKGGRAKKDCGTVKKYQAGGLVTNVYEAKKTSNDKANIAKEKAIKPAFAGTVNKFKCGGKVKKYAPGGSAVTDASALLDPIRSAGTALANNVMGTPQQNNIAQAMMDKIKAKKAAQQAALLGGLGAPMAAQQGAMAGAQSQAPVAVDAMSNVTGQKRGGKVKKGY